LKKIPHYNAYRKSEIPERFVYRDNVRIGPIIFFGDVGYETFRENKEKFNWKDWSNGFFLVYVILIYCLICNFNLDGDHGGDNRNESMHPLFVAAYVFAVFFFL
jgi:hypothetical protein